MTTLADIAKASGVSPAVVSRVINRDQSLRISDETRARVLKSIRELDYSPNVAARSLRSSKSGLLAVALHDVTNPVYSEIMRGAQQAAAKYGKALLLSDASANAESATRLADMIGGGGLDGLILQGAGEIADDVIARAARNNIPTILLQAGLDIEAHLISLPDEQAAYLAVHYLIELGHRKIGCVASGHGLTFTVNRLKGWEAAMHEAGLEASEDRIVYAGPDIKDGAARAAALLDRNPHLTAIIGFNVVAAIGVLGEIVSRGLRVPQDISLIAIHEIKLAAYLMTPLTTVTMPLFEMGERAVEIACQADGEITGYSLIDTPEPRIIRRGSTAAPSR